MRKWIMLIHVLVISAYCETTDTALVNAIEYSRKLGTAGTGIFISGVAADIVGEVLLLNSARKSELADAAVPLVLAGSGFILAGPIYSLAGETHLRKQLLRAGIIRDLPFDAQVHFWRSFLFRMFGIIGTGLCMGLADENSLAASISGGIGLAANIACIVDRSIAVTAPLRFHPDVLPEHSNNRGVR